MVGGEDVKARMNQVMLERARQSRMVQLRRDTIRKIEFLEKKAVVDFHEVYQLVREFFRHYLDKHYEFTINELRAELKKVYIANATRQSISSLLEHLETGEYTNVHYTRDDLTKVLHEFRTVAEQLVRVHSAHRSFFTGIKSLFVKDNTPPTVIAEMPAVEADDAYRVQIYTLIERCYAALDAGQMYKAKNAYKELIAQYENLDIDSRHKFYEVIHQTYSDIRNKSGEVKEQ